MSPGEIVNDQYEVVGALAYGGMGWIYLARDRNVSDRWVVLKGLINKSDAEAREAVRSEQLFLATVEHPLIVEIYNFVEYHDARYIVMEYVPGRSINQLLKQRRDDNDGNADPLPVDWALAYILEILPAFTYLHDSGLLYCDFKPDNLMQVGDSLKLIDLGAVRRIDDEYSAIFGTTGYQAPEVADDGPSIASDIYTIGRSLMVMSTYFPGYQDTYRHSLPPVSSIPLFQRYDSFYRLIQRACAPKPADRFQSAEELRIQVRGVLREVASTSIKGAAKLSYGSQLFTSPTAQGIVDDWRQLPSLLPDSTDPMAEWITSITLDDPQERLTALDRAPQRTPEVMLAQIAINLRLGHHDRVAAGIQELLRYDPWDWRAIWYQGLLAVKTQAWHDAQVAFNTVYSQVPGELAPRFALAMASDHAQMSDLAEELYAICAATDAAYVTPSAFALARLRQRRRDVDGMLHAISLVPRTSRGYAQARRVYAEALLRRGSSLSDLDKSYRALPKAGLDARTQAMMKIEILTKVQKMIRSRKASSRDRFDGQLCTMRNLRPKLEDSYNELAKWTDDPKDRRRLLSKADSIRRWSLL